MNFLAMPTLKNERACFLLPISIRPLRSLNDTFDRARIGIARLGSFDRSAAVTTTSARPTSFFSTGVAFFCLIFMGSYFFLRGVTRFADLADLLAGFLSVTGLSANSGIWAAFP